MDSSAPLRLIFVGTKDFAVPTFCGLIDHGFQVAALVTQPERPQGRKQELVPAQIKVEAIARGIPVLQPESINAGEAISVLRELAPDLIVTVAYGQILSPEVLSIPRLGAINLHGSILPAYRGAAPVARAIQHGDQESGVTVIQMNAKVDAGGILGVARTPIGPDETAAELESRLAILGAPLTVELVSRLAHGQALPIPQEAQQVSRAPKLRKEEGQIDWSRSAQQIHDLVRAMQPWPTAFTHWFEPEASVPPPRMIVHKTRIFHEGSNLPPGSIQRLDSNRFQISTGSGLIEPILVQWPGKKPIATEVFLRGARLNPAGHFGNLTTEA